jgi:VWFA-related protein
VLLAIVTVTVRTQQPAPQRAPGTLREGVTAVLVDVVVRDKRGEPVRDLTEKDFRVLEDGVPQPIGSFTPVFEGTNRRAEAAAPVAAPGTLATGADRLGAPGTAGTGPGITALVFHSLSPDGRRRALQAARAYVGTREETMGNYIGVFALDLSLAPVVPFTRNAVALRQALDRISTQASASFNNPEQREQRAKADGQAASASRAVASAESAGPGAGAAMGGAPGDALLAQMTAGMLRDFEGMEQDQQGYAATNGLFAIVRTLGRIPGRKSLVLFSEGISIPTAVHRLFLGVIDAANRANVSIYTIDAAGLRTESGQSAVRDMVNFGAQAGVGGYSADGASEPYTRNLEANEYSLRADPQTGLAQLAQDTGGLLFRDTNNLAPAFDRIESDLRNYYLLGYTPINANYDGRFRTIQVKVMRPGVTVAARKGYFAVRDPGGAVVNPWEAPALGALEQKPVPNAFPVRAAAR